MTMLNSKEQNLPTVDLGMRPTPGNYLSGLVLLFTWVFFIEVDLQQSYGHVLMNTLITVLVLFGVKTVLNRSNDFFILGEAKRMIYFVKDFLKN